MSLHQLANHMSAQGRGPDSTLVHMSPREVSGLQSLAMANGGTLTINPKTGLPEAGFLDSLLPTLIGGAATFFSGGTITPIMAALGVTGLTALTSKDLGKGLMAGLGAYGGAGIAGGLMNFGEAAIGAEAAKGALPSGVNPLQAVGYEPAQAAATKAARAGATNFDRLSRGVTEGFKNPMGALSSIGGGNKFIGAAMIGAPLMSALTSQDQTSVPTAEEIKFDPRYTNINIRRQQRPYEPDTGSSGQRRYFGDTYVTQYGADGGAVLNDGIQHFAYGGGTIDPNYDYSGYGRKKTDAVTPRPNIPRPDIPRPDFVGADGKTYRYDPIKKNYYVIKEAPAKTNPGVETLMGGDGSPAGGEKVFNTTPNYGVLANIGKSLSDIGLTTIGDYLSQNAREGRTGQQEKATDAQDSSRDDTRGPVTGTTTQSDINTGTNLQGQGSAQTGLYGDAAAGMTGGIGSLSTGQAAAQVIGDMGFSISNTRGPNQNPDTNTNNEGMNTGTTGGIPSQAEQAFAGAQAQAQAQAQASRANAQADNFGDRPQTNPTASLPTLGYTGNLLGLLNDALTSSPTSLNPAPVETREVTPNLLGGGDTSTGPSGAPPGGGNVNDGSGGGGTDFSGVDSAGTGFAGDVFAYGGMTGYAQGGLGSLGGYSDGGRLLRGPGDGVSDSIPATVGNRQPARLADGEFVVPARIVSELGNGSTEAGARALYKMMDRIQANRRKTTGRTRVAVDSKSHKYLPA